MQPSTTVNARTTPLPTPASTEQAYGDHGVLTVLPLPAAITDGRGRIVRANAAFWGLMGMDPSLEGTTTLEALAPAADRRALRALLADAADGGASPAKAEQRYERRDGEPVWTRTTISRIGDGDAGHLLAVLSDITDYKRGAETLEAARAKAEEATHAKSEFLAVMSHEIRTPMNGVVGMVDLLLDTELSAAQREIAETIRKSGESLITIINDILDLSKIEAGRIELEAAPFDVVSAIEGALDLVLTQATGRPLELAYHVAPDVPARVRGDALRLQQILVNLLSNALKFTERGEVVLSVRVAEVRGEDVVLQWSVRDTGVGIPAERIDRLFESFSQLDASTSRKYGGTGLGLAISRQLSEMLGGTMWVESDEGVGSTFYFTTRLQPLPPEDAPLPAALAGRHILLVEEHAPTREMLKGHLDGGDVRVDAVDGAAEAVRRIRRTTYDAAVVAADLETIDGPTLAHILRENAPGGELPVLILRDVARQVVVSGWRPTSVLAKPVKRRTLRSALAAAVADPDHAAGLDAPEAGDAGTASKPLRILVAEDNPTNVRVAVHMLTRLGFEADVATNGREAVEAVCNTHYDVVFMDVMMPEMDGIEAVRRIRAELPADERPHIVAVTANAMEGDRERCLRAGMDDYIAKPLRKNDLATALGRCTTGEAPTHATRPAPAAASSPIDVSTLEALPENLGIDDHRILLGIADEFLDDAAGLVTRVREAAAAGDAEALQHAAHTLKSGSAMFGAFAFSEACKELEHMGGRGCLDGAAARAADLERAFEDVRRTLRRHLHLEG